MDDARVLRRAALVPDEVTFVDERGRKLRGWEPWRPDFAAKIFVARKSIQSKQSIETTLTRFLYVALREYTKERKSEGQS